jgi:hypothetical protein
VTSICNREQALSSVQPTSTCVDRSRHTGCKAAVHRAMHVPCPAHPPVHVALACPLQAGDCEASVSNCLHTQQQQETVPATTNSSSAAVSHACLQQICKHFQPGQLVYVGITAVCVGADLPCKTPPSTAFLSPRLPHKHIKHTAEEVFTSPKSPTHLAVGG